MTPRDHGPDLAYITRTFVEEPHWIAPARAAGEALRPGIQISPYEGHLLRWLVRLKQPEQALEIGSFMGVSAMWLGDGLPPSARLQVIEANPDYAARAAQHLAQSPAHARIMLQVGDAHQWLEAQPAVPSFDFVFIDAEKPGYARYLDALLPRLRPQAWIVGDNTLLFGALSGRAPQAASAAARQSMQQFNARLADAARFDSILLPTPEGMTVACLRA